MKYAFQILTIVLLFVSLIFNKQKTTHAIKIALKRVIAILPAFVTVIIFTSIVLSFVSPESIQKVLGASSNRWAGMIIASAVGSIAVMPGFVAFPLAAILKENGVLFMVISAFTTTLMMVGIVTFPIERAFLGTKVALFRNFISLLIALTVAVITGFIFGEIIS